MTAIVYFGLLTLPFGAVNVLIIKRIGMTDLIHRQSLINLIENWTLKFIKDKLVIFIGVSAVMALFLATQTNLKLESVVFILFLTITTLVTQLYAASLQASKKFFTSGLVGIAMTLLKIVGGIIVLFFIPKLSFLYLSMVLATFGAMLIARSWVIKKSSKFQTLKYALSSPLLYLKKNSVYIPVLATLGMVGILSLDVMMVKKFFSPDEVGLYASLSLLAKIIFYLTLPVSTVAYTFFTSRDSKKDSLKILITTSLLVMVAGASILACYYFLPNLVVTLVFGSKFLDIAPLAYLAGIYGIGYSLSYLYVQFLISVNDSSSLLSLWVLMGQAVALCFFHQSFGQVMTIGIMTSVLLAVFSLFAIFRHYVEKKRVQFLSL